METKSLYIHIPFCVSKCSYCDFYSIPIGNSNVGDFSCFSAYLKALKNEIDFRLGYFNIKELETIYIGGGTPSLLSVFQIKELLDFIKSKCQVDENAEITLEANPQDISDEFLEELGKTSVNRLSVGIQCYNDSVLKLLNRRCDLAQVNFALKSIYENWVLKGKSFSCDLISGLPNLSKADFLLGIEKVISHGVNHISLYSLMIEEGTPLEKQISKEEVAYSEENNENQWILGRDFLEEKGFYQYEVSNFSKPGFESRHNKVYWHIENYLGVGAGATGTVDFYRWTNAFDVEKYTEVWENENPKTREKVKIPQEEENLSKKEKEFEFLMMGFRLRKGVRASVYKSLFNEDLALRLGYSGNGVKIKKSGVFDKWLLMKRAWVEVLPNDEMIFSLTKEGLLFLNQFLEEIL